MPLVRPATPEHWREARRLVEEYARSLDLDLSFQDFQHEIESLATEYGPPGGAFLLAEGDAGFVGCVGLRRLTAGDGEIKRLYVSPVARAGGIGRVLAEGIIALARELGYRRLLLDTLPTMSAARALYRSLGFRTTEPYRFNPVAGTSFLELTLR